MQKGGHVRTETESGVSLMQVKERPGPLGAERNKGGWSSWAYGESEALPASRLQTLGL